MLIWCTILHRILNINNETTDVIVNSKNLWEDVYTNQSIYSSLIPNIDLHIYIFNLLEKYGRKNLKFEIYKILDNPFKSIESKNDIQNKFEKAQRFYYILTKFVNSCKMKKAKRIVTTDLSLNEITLQENLSISIYQSNSIYYFSIRDLISICNSALMFSHDFFSDPQFPKNPYINIPFTYGMLLKIYNSIRYSRYKMPILLDLFYKSNFNIDLFLTYYEYNIRNECINNFIKNGDISEKHDYIKDMLSIHLRTFIPVLKISIHDTFPKKILAEAFNPILHNYLLSEFSLLPSHKRWKKTMYYEIYVIRIYYK